MEHREEHNALRLASESLALILSAHLAVVTALLTQPGKCGAKVLRAARDIHRTIRQHLKVLYRLRAQALQSDLKNNPAFRAQVAHDLGGKLAMVKWERRKRGAQIHQQFLAARQAQGLGVPQDPIKSHASSTSYQDISKHASGAVETKPRKAWKPKTDRTGHFRLATIPTGQTGRKVTTRIVKNPCQKRRPFQLIEVTPRELRAPAFAALNFQYPPPPNIGMPRAGSFPPIDRPPIH